jgi:HK97 family phage prohead protease
MPNPKNFNTRDDFMKACVPVVIKEGTAKDGDQAVAICSSMWRRRNQKMDDTAIETKNFGGKIIEVKQHDRNGVAVGIVAGHIAAWAPDIGGIYGIPDKFHKGAFLRSIDEHVSRNNRPVRLRDMHGRTIGGFPIDTVHEDDIGLFGVGEINLEVQQGKEAFSLARQGILTDFSIGFIAKHDDISGGQRDIFQADVMEGSIVDEPINRGAQVTEVKSAVVRFQDLPLADRTHGWDKKSAADRAKLFASEEQKKAFIWVKDGEFKLLITDIVDGEMKVVPRAIFEAAINIQRGDVEIPDDDLPDVVRHLERYFAKMGVVSPFAIVENHCFGMDEVKSFDRRDLERALIGSGLFSQKAAKVVASRYTEPTYNQIVETLRTIRFG